MTKKEKTGINFFKSNIKRTGMNPIEVLSKYGEVKTCKAIEGVAVMILVTTGFSQDGMGSFLFIKDCLACFPDYGHVDNCISEEGLGMVVLTKIKG